MKNISLSFLITLTCLSFAYAQTDVTGSSDHSLISRYPGSYISYFEAKNFHNYKIALGDETGYRQISDWLDVAGRFQRMHYLVEGERTLDEVFGNYKQAIDQADFEILREGFFPEKNVDSKMGGKTWITTYFKYNSLPNKSEIKIGRYSSTSGGSGYLAASLKQGDKIIYLVLVGHQYSNNEVAILLDIIESDKMETGLVAIDADYLIGVLEKEGHIPIYDIHFDFNKAIIKEESRKAIDELFKLLSGNPKLSLYIVGHTDMVGSEEYNMKLSSNRAEAVKQALVSRGISPNRLDTKGVGYFSPVSNNSTETGKATNRRVELVVRL